MSDDDDAMYIFIDLTLVLVLMKLAHPCLWYGITKTE